MERPLCPLCKTNHFAREPHAFKKAPEKIAPPELPAPFPGPSEVSSSAKQPGGAPFDRKTYQREYMRKYRARK